MENERNFISQVEEEIQEFDEFKDKKDEIIFNLQDGDIDKAKEIIKEFSVSDEVVKEVVKKAIISLLTINDLEEIEYTQNIDDFAINIDIDGVKKIIDEFSVAEDILQDPEIKDAAKKIIVLVLEVSDIQSAKKTQEILSVSDQITQEAVKIALITHLTDADDDDIIPYIMDMLDVFPLSDETICSSEVQNAAKEVMIRLLNNTNERYSYASQIQEALSVSDEIMQSPEVQEAVKSRILSLLGLEDIDYVVGEIQSISFVSDEIMQSPEVQEAVKSRILSLLELDDIDLAEEICEMFSVSDEIMQEVVIQATLSLLTNKARSGGVLTVQGIIETFPIFDEAIQSPEVQEAVKSRILSLLKKVCFVEAMFIQEMLSVPDEAIQSAEVQEAAKSAIITFLKSNLDNLNDIQNFLKEFPISDSIVQSLEVQEAVREGLIDQLKRGEINLARKINNIFSVPDEAIQSAEVQEAAKSAIITFLKSNLDNLNDIQNFLKEFPISDSIVQSLEVQEAVREGLIDQLKRGEINLARKINNIFSVPDEAIQSAEVQEAAKSAIITFLKSNLDNLNDIQNILKEFFISDETIQSAEVQAAVIQGLRSNLKRGIFDSAKEIQNIFSVPDEAIQSAEVQEAAIDGILFLLKNEHSSVNIIVENILNDFAISDTLIQSAVVQKRCKNSIVYLLKFFQVNAAKKIQKVFSVSDQVLQESAKEAVIFGLSEIIKYHSYETINNIGELLLISDKIIYSSEIQKKAIEAMIHLLTHARGSAAQQIKDVFLVSNETIQSTEVQSAVKKGVIQSMFLPARPGVNPTKNFYDTFPVSDEIIKSAEVQNAAKERIIFKLKGTDVDGAKEMLEYFERVEIGYIKRFLEENKEELNGVIVKSFEIGDIRIYKYLKGLEGQENIRFINVETNFLADIIKQNQGLESSLIKGYFNCKAEGIINESNYKDILDLVDRLPILNITIVKEYLEAKSNQRETEYLDKIIGIGDKMISGGITEEEKSKEYFQDVLEYIYPNNIADYADYNSVSTCQDRSQDLEVFNIKEKYPIDIVDRGKLELREGRELDKRSLENIQKEREDIMKVYSERGIENIRQRLDEIIEEMFSKMEEENTLGIELDKLMNQEEKIYATMLSSRLHKGIKAEDIKKSILYYNFAYLSNIERYQIYTDEGIEKRYEQIMELSEFYKDTIKEATNIIIEKGKKNPIFEGVKENIYVENQKRERREELGRLQVDKLGLNDKFIRDMRNILIKKRLRKDTTKEEKIELEKKYSLDRVREIISRYESMTSFLEEEASNSPNSNTKTFYGRLKGQRNKTLEAFKTLTGEEQDLLTTHLGNINLKEVIDLKISASNGIYDEELFDRLIEQSISNLYQEEYDILETEANKFILVDYDENGKKIEKKPKRLNSYITKDALSAYARMVGGVCVAGCNPDKGSKNIWDMPNYFQLVLQNPENKRCVGLVLLHHFEDENGQKILSASYNPSSTYLFSVDEGSLFNELNNTLIEFAEKNNFDKIVMSKDKDIRTNRVDTIFETSMDKAIDQYKDNNNGEGVYLFSEDKYFSYYPTYKLKDMDIVWSR